MVPYSAQKDAIRLIGDRGAKLKLSTELANVNCTKEKEWRGVAEDWVITVENLGVHKVFKACRTLTKVLQDCCCGLIVLDPHKHDVSWRDSRQPPVEASTRREGHAGTSSSKVREPKYIHVFIICCFYV